MSTERKIEATCSVCGKTSEQIQLTSTNRFGSSDLDFRPPEMMRSTMWCWLQSCPHCGYVAAKLEDKTCVTEEWLKKEKEKIPKKVPILAKEFDTRYRIAVEEGNFEDAYKNALRAAWACDDRNKKKLARTYRLAAVEMIDKIADSKTGDEKLALIVTKADALRRAKEFERLFEEINEKEIENEQVQKLIRFELERARKRDTKCYTGAYALEVMR